MGAWGIGHWVIVLLVVLLVFGTKRLRGAGRDLGEALKGFKKGLNEGDAPTAELDGPAHSQEHQASGKPVDTAPR